MSESCLFCLRCWVMLAVIPPRKVCFENVLCRTRVLASARSRASSPVLCFHCPVLPCKDRQLT